MYTTGDKLLNVMKEEEIGIAELARISGVLERTYVISAVAEKIKTFPHFSFPCQENIVSHRSHFRGRLFPRFVIP